MTKLPLSIFIITKNEEDRIEATINASLAIAADEIIVIDSGSTDKTCEIAKKLGATVVFNDWKGYGQQKIFGENQCKNNWILNIDADEEISSELASEIRKLFQEKVYENYIGFHVKIVNKFRFEKKPHKFAYYYNQLRLYNKNFAGFKNSSIHDSVEIYQQNINHGSNLKVGQLYNIIYHQSFRSFAHWIEKINSYSTMQAKDSLKRNKNISVAKVFITPFIAFLKAYFIRRYFIYGFDGLIYSALFSFSRFAKMIKIREIFREKNSKL